MEPTPDTTSATSQTPRGLRRRTRPIAMGLSAIAMALGTFVVANAAGADEPQTDTATSATTSSEVLHRRGTVNANAVVAGATFVPVNPYRAFDSRFEGICSGDIGPFGPFTALVIDVAVDQNDACNVKIPTENLVAVTYNLTVANTVGRGFLSVAPSGQPSTGTSAVNWTQTGQIVPNGGVVGVGEAFESGLGFVLVESGPNGSTNFFIDITGYYTR